jgi:hypothetical protein
LRPGRTRERTPWTEVLTWSQAQSPLLTDLYQLNMIEAYLAYGETKTAVFELFVRKRLMPKAAHNRSDSTCTGSGRSEYSRVERLSLSAAVNRSPPPPRGGGKSRGLSSCATVTVEAPAASAALERIPELDWRRVIILTPLLMGKFDGARGSLADYDLEDRSWPDGGLLDRSGVMG